MNHKFLLLLLVCIISLCQFVSRVLGSPIVGGTEDFEHNIKYHVSFHKFDSEKRAYEYFCGGTIIDEKYVLSAAKCFMIKTDGKAVSSIDLAREQPKILAGTNKIQGSGIENEVVTIFIPTSYQFLPTSYADIAVVQLRDNLGVTGNRDLKIMHFGQLPDNEVGVQATFCGFGYYEHSISKQGKFFLLRNLSDYNRFLTVKLLDGSRCPDFHSKICARPYDTTGIHAGCQGDLGGGLIFEGKIIGVFSYGPQFCNSSHAPNVFTRISAFMEHIIRAMDETVNHLDMLDMHVLRKPASSHQSTIHHAESSRRHN